MKLNLNILFFAIGALILALLSWNIYLLKVNSDLQKKANEIQENFRYLDGYNKIIQYDLTTARDSVRILEDWINANENKIVVP